MTTNMTFGQKLDIAIGCARESQQPANHAQIDQLENTIDSLVGSWGEWNPVKQRYAMVWPAPVLAIWPHPKRGAVSP